VAPVAQAEQRAQQAERLEFLEGQLGLLLLLLLTLLRIAAADDSHAKLLRLGEPLLGTRGVALGHLGRAGREVW